MVYILYNKKNKQTMVMMQIEIIKALRRGLTEILNEAPRHKGNYFTMQTTYNDWFERLSIFMINRP
jgi:hypothetical protein